MTGDDAAEKLLTEFTPTSVVIVEWIAIGAAIGVASAFAFVGVYATATGTASLGSGPVSAGTALLWGVILLLSLAVVVVLHEAVHAAVVVAYGGDVSFGVGLAQFVTPYAYVTTTERLPRNRFVAVALAPLVVLTAVGLPAMVALDAVWLVVPLSFNAAGAIGDLWMAGLLLRYPPHVTVEDSIDGVRIYGTEADAPLAPTRARVFLRRATVGTMVGFGALFLALSAAPVLLAVLGVNELAIGAPETPFGLFYFERTEGGGFASGVNPLGAFAASLLVGTAVAVVWTAVQGGSPEDPAGDR